VYARTFCDKFCHNCYFRNDRLQNLMSCLCERRSQDLVPGACVQLVTENDDGRLIDFTTASPSRGHAAEPQRRGAGQLGRTASLQGPEVDRRRSRIRRRRLVASSAVTSEDAPPAAMPRLLSSVVTPRTIKGEPRQRLLTVQSAVALRRYVSSSTAAATECVHGDGTAR